MVLQLLFHLQHHQRHDESQSRRAQWPSADQTLLSRSIPILIAYPRCTRMS